LAESRRSIVADAGPLIGLARVGGLRLIRSVFDEVLVPPAVLAECCRDISLPGAKGIRTAIESGELHVVETVTKAELVWPPALGVGERATIEMAMAEKTGVLMDDLPGRRLAKRCGIPFLGTGGLLLLAKGQDVIEEIGPWIADLRQQGYYLSKVLVSELLRRAGES
jgi:predicted nucleic acid-binding protein